MNQITKNKLLKLLLKTMLIIAGMVIAFFILLELYGGEGFAGLGLFYLFSIVLIIYLVFILIRLIKILSESKNFKEF
ncbi:hypothetical protein [Marinicella meishanensis]|uniref:hypothetical protein n=1 Tax=Marinicella meishanensis TaxID=2873263 RepID=UPI001CBD5F1E|nr:hypothetical protein [Marinicella sp. NBU2979]